MEPVVEFRNVTYQYPLTKHPAVQELNLQLEKGKLYGVIGENGAGKTTLSVMICGFVPSFFKGKLQGELLIKGKDVTDYGPGQLSKIAGYVFQNPFNQISGVKQTVFEELAFGLENFGYPPQEMEDRVLEIAERAKVTGLLEKNPFELSGGQQQRVALASVLILNPEIVVIDEPTSQLDPEGTESIFEIISMMKQTGSTIILVEHKIDLIAEYADELIVMKGGRVIRKGGKQAILSDISLLEEGVQLPRVTLLANEMQKNGMELDYLPITEQQAYEVIGKALERGASFHA